MTTALAQTDQWAAVESKLVAALPQHVNSRQFAAVALAAVKNPLLQRCDRRSVLGALWECAIMGWVPDSVMQQAAILPFKGQAVVVPMYKGLLELARRSGMVQGVSCKIVYANDAWHYEDGTDPQVRHTPWWDKAVGAEQPGQAVAVYCVLHLVGDGKQIEVMRYSDALAYRERSASYRRGADSPWKTDEAAMVRKTCLKQCLKLSPQSAELARAVHLDDQAEMGTQRLAMPEVSAPPETPPDHDDLIDGGDPDAPVPPPEYPEGEEPDWELGEPDPDADGRE